MRHLASTLLFLILAATTAWAEPPSLGPVADFTLTERSGQTVRLADLRDRIWVADFIFTTCPGPCPMMTQKMAQLQQKLPPGVQLVSFTVDPDNDTPEVLAAYARRAGADEHRWWFLTGDKQVIFSLARGSFHLAVEPGQGGVIHGTHFVLVDGHGQIRGFYDSGDPGALESLVADARPLAAQTAVRATDVRPMLNACLNAFSAVLVLFGYFFIRRRRIAAHRFCMILAFISSSLFLISYLVYHWQIRGGKHFAGEGVIRPIYFSLLTSHTILAIIIVPLILITFSRAFKARFELHKAIARWTLPLWLYVSCTGVLVYFMLYRWFL